MTVHANGYFLQIIITYLYMHKTISPLYPELAVSMQYHGADAPVAAVLSGWWLRRSRWSGLRALLWVKFLWMPDAFCSLLLSQKGIPSAPKAAYLGFGFASHPSLILVYSVGYPAYLLSLVLILFFVLDLANSVTWVAVFMFSHPSYLQLHKFLFTLWWTHCSHTYMKYLHVVFGYAVNLLYIYMYVCVVGYTILVCF